MDGGSLLRDAVATTADHLALPGLLASLQPLHATGDTFAGFIRGALASCVAEVDRAATGASFAARVGDLWQGVAGKWEAAPRGVEGWCVGPPIGRCGCASLTVRYASGWTAQGRLWGAGDSVGGVAVPIGAVRQSWVVHAIA